MVLESVDSIVLPLDYELKQLARKARAKNLTTQASHTDAIILTHNIKSAITQ